LENRRAHRNPGKLAARLRPLASKAPSADTTLRKYGARIYQKNQGLPVKMLLIDEKNIFEKMVQIPAAPRIKRDHILIRDLVSWPDRRVLVFNLVCE